MGRVEALAMKEVRFARRCWLSVAGVEEDEVVVVKVGDVYVVGVLDDWYVLPPDAVRRFLAKLLNAAEEDISLER
jgi:myo-inositol catabolism protein IolC